MRHAIWLMPLTLCICLLAWCIHHPLAGSGREFLALLLGLFSLLGMAFIRFDVAGPITGYEVIHTNDPV